MTYQAELDFVHTRENNAVSQKILDNNRVKLSSQVIKILKMLTYGYQNEHGVKVYNIDFATAYTQHGIGDLRRRICDIQEKLKIPVDRAYQSSGKATYSLNEFSQIKAKELLNTLK